MQLKNSEVVKQYNEVHSQSDMQTWWGLWLGIDAAASMLPSNTYFRKKKSNADMWKRGLKR